MQYDYVVPMKLNLIGVRKNETRAARCDLGFGRNKKVSEVIIRIFFALVLYIIRPLNLWIEKTGNFLTTKIRANTVKCRGKGS